MKRASVILGLILVSLSVGAQAQNPPAPPAPAESGEAVMKKSKELIYKIGDQKNKVNLHLIAKDGSTREIVAQRYWKNYSGQGGVAAKTAIFTQSPPDLKGQGILIWDYTTGKPEDLWLYLPALRNVRRVQPAEQDEAFLGSDLTFGDMGQRQVEEDIHTVLKKEVLNGTPCLVVESIPRGESMYQKRVTWISESDSTIKKIDYYDRKGDLLKHQIIDWQVLKEKGEPVYVWKKTELQNVQNGHKTIFEVSDLKVNIGLADSDFTERVLKTEGLRK